MNQIILKSPNQNISFDIKSRKRGAKVFGMPVSPDLEHYIEEVSPQVTSNRLFTMFFAGKVSPVFDRDFDSDFDDEDDEL